MALPNAGVTASNLDNAEKLEALLYAALNPTAASVSLTSGTAYQDTTGLPSIFQIEVTGGTSGTIAVVIGSTSSPATSVVVAAATANVTVSAPLPAGWYLKATVGGSAALGTITQLTGV